MRQKNYSRLARLEEKRSMRSAIIFGALSILILILFFFFGLQALAKFSGFLSDLGSSNKPIEKNDFTPPAPPQFDSLPEYTNEKDLTASGTAETGAEVTVFVNGKESQVIADAEGRFTVKVPLAKGENKVHATAKDLSGNLSEESKTVKVVFDDTSPDIEISSPQPDATFSGQKQKQITIEGKTEPDIEVTVNDRTISVDEEGKFKTTYTLSDGSNELRFKATDKAGNSTERSFFVTFNP